MKFETAKCLRRHKKYVHDVTMVFMTQLNLPENLKKILSSFFSDKMPPARLQIPVSQVLAEA